MGATTWDSALVRGFRCLCHGAEDALACVGGTKSADDVMPNWTALGVLQVMAAYLCSVCADSLPGALHPRQMARNSSRAVARSFR